MTILDLMVLNVYKVHLSLPQLPQVHTKHFWEKIFHSVPS